MPAGTPCGGPVVLGVAPGTEPGYLLRWAAEEAQRRGTPLRLVAAYEPVPPCPIVPVARPFNTDDPYGARRAARRRLDRLAGWLRERYPDLAVAGVAIGGSAVSVLAAQAAEAGLLVVGRHERGRFAEALFGSTAVDVAESAGCPVVAVPDRIRPVPTDAPVVVGVKAASRSPEAAVRFAFTAASRSGAPLHAVHYWRPGEGSAAEHELLLAEAVAGFRAEFPDVSAHLFAMEGDPADLLVSESRLAGLIVLGPSGGWRYPRRLGVVGAAVLRGSACPVALAAGAAPDRLSGPSNEADVHSGQ